MTTASQKTLQVLEQIVKEVPVGTLLSRKLVSEQET